MRDVSGSAGSADKSLEDRAEQLSEERASEESRSAEHAIEDRAEDEPGSADKPPLKKSVPRRLLRERRWDGNVISQRDSLMSHARKVLGMEKEAAQEWVYKQLAERYPPLPKKEPRRKRSAAGQSNSAKTLENRAQESLPYGDGSIEVDKEQVEDNQEERGLGVELDAEGAGESVGAGAGARSQSDTAVIRGLDKIPASWGALPPNASLAAEIQWVQSVRVDVVEELPGGGHRVRLNRADRPAPSKAAIGWLETSIRAYGKYCDIAAKAAANYTDEEAVVKRERLSIERVRQLLESMVSAKK